MALKKDLPKLVKDALKEDDESTRYLVNFLLNSVASEHSEKQIKDGLFDEIKKLYSLGKLKEIEEQE